MRIAALTLVAALFSLPAAAQPTNKGRSETAPGQTGQTPGQLHTAPGGAPGQMQTTPGGAKDLAPSAAQRNPAPAPRERRSKRERSGRLGYVCGDRRPGCYMQHAGGTRSPSISGRYLAHAQRRVCPRSANVGGFLFAPAALNSNS